MHFVGVDLHKQTIRACEMIHAGTCTLGGTMSVIVPLLASAAGLTAAAFMPHLGEKFLSEIVSAIFTLVALAFGGRGLRTLWNCFPARAG